MRRKVVIALSAILFFFVCSLSIAKEPSHLNFLLITIDTIRSDHLGCYGYEKIKTPHIDQLAKNGVLFENAFSPVPITLPSHASILTGTYPTFHGIRNNGTYAMSESVVTLAELLKSKGYATAAFVSAYVMDKRFGLDQGFDIYNDDLSHEKDQTFLYKERRAEAVTLEAIQWLKETGPLRFFLWVHYFDPHMHYNPPPPFSDEYADNLYDGEIAYTDHWIGVLMETMHQPGLSENTLIVLTGDHGEGLGEHEEKTHGIFIYDATLKVPLIFTCPKLFPKSKRITALVRLIDIAPTILAAAGCKSYKDMQGVSLLPLMCGKVDNLDLVLYCESFYPQFSHNWSPLEGLRTEKWKYIEAPIEELYRVDKDTQENRNIFDQEQAQGKKLALKLSRLKDSITSSLIRQDAQRISLDKETKERLQSLGYVFAPTRMNEKGEYPDPKKMVDMMKYFDQGLDYFVRAQYQKARDKFLKVVEKYPQDVQAYTILGHTFEAMGENEKSIEAFEEALRLGYKDLRIYIKLGTMYMKHNRYQEGVAIFCEALKVNPRCKEAYINLALYHLERDEFDQALLQFQKALEIDPHDVTTHNYLAVIYQNQGRYDQAILSCQAALNMDPNNISSLLTLGSTLLYKHRYQEALDALQKALKIKPDSGQAHYFAGLVTFKQNRLDKAIEHFKKAVQIDPNWAELHFNLGFIYHQQKNFAQAINEYQIALELKPDLIDARQMLQQINIQLQHD